MQQSDFQQVLHAVRRGLPVSMQFEAAGDVYCRNFVPQERLFLLGGGHVAKALCSLANTIGFAVTVVDDRPEYSAHDRFPEAKDTRCGAFEEVIPQLGITERDYVAVLTRGHQFDRECLRTVLSGPQPYYLGLIGSKRRVTGLLEQLGQEGYEQSRLEAIHTPIGLDIGAKTVEEIAVSIAAELISCRRSKGGYRRSNQLVEEQTDLELLTFLAEDPMPKVLLMVIDTEGSTPVKSGAMMAVDLAQRMVGTVGGGSGEFTLAQSAYSLISTGQSRCVCVDLTNDVTADDNTCGGKMLVLLTDVEVPMDWDDDQEEEDK